MQDAFTVGGERLRYPGDPAGSPWNTIQCRCTTLPVLDDMAAGPEEQPSINRGQIREYTDEFGDTYVELSGGDWPAKVRTSTPSRPPDDYPVPHRWSTVEEQRMFLQRLDELPAGVKGLWRARTGQPVLAIAQTDTLYGLNQSNFVFVDEDTFHGTDAQGKTKVSKHEFIHNIANQDIFSNNWGSYQPERFFQHAIDAKRGMKENEDLTMLLTYFDNDKERWIDNLTGIEGGFSRQDLAAKVDTAISFIRFAMGGL